MFHLKYKMKTKLESKKHKQTSVCYHVENTRSNKK